MHNMNDTAAEKKDPDEAKAEKGFVFLFCFCCSYNADHENSIPEESLFVKTIVALIRVVAFLVM